MHGLSKSRILAHRQCPRRLWLHVHHPELEEVGGNTAARFAAGHHVGEVARTLEACGVVIDAEDVAQALSDTAELLAVDMSTLFEAAFAADGVLIRADVIRNDTQDRWEMVEVKSATGVKPYHLIDAAVQTWVVRRAGVSLSRIEIAHIDNGFIYPGGGDYRGLLTYVDVTEEIAELEDEVQEWIIAARATLSGDDPRTAPGKHCHDPFDCPFLGYCVPTADPDGFQPDILPRNRGLAAQLREEGYADLRDVPEGRLTNPVHLRVWEATRSARAYIDDEAGRILSGLPWLYYYLDFETIQFAVPIWAGTRPYAQIPFQWSCHIENRAGEVAHLSFLADGTGDPRRAFAESLLGALGTSGAIIVYHAAFERGRMEELAEAFPDLASGLRAAIDRIVDLLPIVRDHYYHPGMRGSWSIKAVLPTIAPELAYDDLAVAHGGMAQEAFTEMLRPDLTHERRAELREGLLKYCERDTWAMVRIAHFLRNGH
jgi:hypothetical protein